jgi:hypothetical protein
MSDLIRGRKPLLALIAAVVAMAAPATATAQNSGVDVYVEQVPTPSGTKATPKRSTPAPAPRPAPRNYTAPRPAAPAAPVQRYQAPAAPAPAAPAHKKAVRKHKRKRAHHAAAVPKAKPAATAPVVPKRVAQAPTSASTGADFGPLALGLALLGITGAVIGAAAMQRRRVARPAS